MNTKYDMIIMDIFQSALIPEKFQTQEFIDVLNTRLHDKGILLFNRMAISDRDERENKQFRKLFKTNYPEMAELKIKDNLVFVNNSKLIS